MMEGPLLDEALTEQFVGATKVPTVKDIVEDVEDQRTDPPGSMA